MSKCLVVMMGACAMMLAVATPASAVCFDCYRVFFPFPDGTVQEFNLCLALGGADAVGCVESPALNLCVPLSPGTCDVVGGGPLRE